MVSPRKFLFGIGLLSMVQFKTSVEAIDPVTVGFLLQEGLKLAAPFTETAANRLHSSIFGSGRATRSSDVILFNASSKTFQLRRTKCKSGGFSTDMFPEHLLPSHQSIVFGIESNKLWAGVSCMAEYSSRGGSRFTVDVKNPLFKSSKVSEENTRDLNVVHTRGDGFSNQVRFIIEDA